MNKIGKMYQDVYSWSTFMTYVWLFLEIDPSKGRNYKYREVN